MATWTRTGRGPFTVADLARTPEDAVKRELIDGWLYIEGQPVDALDAVVEVTSPRRAHQDAVGRLFVACLRQADEHGGWAAVAPMDVVLDDGRSVQPDVLYVAPEDADRLQGERYGTPQLFERGRTVVSDAVPGLVVAVDDLLP